MDHTEIYEKISLKHAVNVRIKHSLCFYNPYEVYEALLNNKEVKSWLEFISNNYTPPTAKVLLIYPCSTEKPYHKSRSYKILYNTLSKLGDKRKEVHLLTISEPFGLIPEEFYENKYDWYDCPGLFKWWCRKYHQPYSKEYVDKCVQILANYVAKFFMRAKIQKCYSRMVAFVRTFSSGLKVNHDHTHRRIIELACQIAKVHIDLLPPKSLVAEIVQKKGKFAWDMYGIAHPLAQEYLLNYLRKVLEDEN
jgi:archaeosine synthase